MISQASKEGIQSSLTRNNEIFSFFWSEFYIFSCLFKIGYQDQRLFYETDISIDRKFLSRHQN